MAKLLNKFKTVLIMGMAMLFALQLSPANVSATDDTDFANRFSMSESGLKDSGSTKNDTSSTFQKVFDKYRVLISGISGVVAITMLLLFILQAFRLGNSAHNPSERQKAMNGLIWLGIATAISGSVSLFAGLFYNMLK